MKVLATLMDKLDRFTPFGLLCANSALCAFVLLAHGGALLLVKAGKAPEMAQEITVAYFSIPAALIALVLSAIALVRKDAVGFALKVHAILSLALAAYMLVFGVAVVLHGPPGAPFVWNPILFAVVFGYPFLLLQRAFPIPAFNQSPLRCAPLLAVGVSLLVSAGVFWRTLVAT